MWKWNLRNSLSCCSNDGIVYTRRKDLYINYQPIYQSSDSIDPTRNCTLQPRLYTAQHIETHERVLIKRIPSQYIKQRLKRKALRYELQILAICQSHENIQSLYEVITKDEIIEITYEYAKGGPIMDRLYKHSIINNSKECEIVEIMKQMAIAIEYLHTHAIIHGEIRPEYLLYTDMDETIHRVILSHFSQAAFYREFTFEMDRNNSYKHSRTNSNESTFLWDDMHHIKFLPPFLLRKDLKEWKKKKSLSWEQAQEIDIWAFGITLYILLYGEFPFQGKDIAEIRENICKQTLVLPQETVSLAGRNLLTQILTKDPTHKKLKIHDILAHPWLASNCASTRPWKSERIQQCAKFSHKYQQEVRSSQTQLQNSMYRYDEHSNSYKHHTMSMDQDVLSSESTDSLDANINGGAHEQEQERPSAESLMRMASDEIALYASTSTADGGEHSPTKQNDDIYNNQFPYDSDPDDDDDDVRLLPSPFILIHRC